MDETERKKTEFKNLKYLSLAPQSSPDYKASSKLLYEKIKDDNVYNIGIIAQYGAGKSSLIKTFKDAYENKQQNDNQKEINTLNISLATFNIDQERKMEDKEDKTEENEANNTEENNNSNYQIHKERCENVIDQAIEKSILQQMLYKKERNDLPKSRINRIKSFSAKKFIGISALSMMILLSVFVLTLLGMSLNGRNVLAFKGSDVVYGLLGFCMLAFFAGGLFQVIEVNRIKLKDIELSFASECNESLLNKFLDEVIYFFQKTKYNVVIFEDLDRFNNLSIFVKLRELNIILNSNQKLKSKKKITFVYAVKNTMFSNGEDRAKFFDFIISVLPVLSPINASSKIVDGLKECGFPKDWLPDDYVNDISNYFNEMRVLNSTINDCVQLVQSIDFSQINEKDIRKQNMNVFSLMAYKNIYPKEFVALEERKGELYDILARVSIKREEHINELASKIENNNNFLKKLEYQLNLNKRDLFLLTKGALLDLNKKVVAPSGKAFSEEIDFKDENLGLYLKTGDVYDRYRGLQAEYVYATIKQINEHLKGMTIAERYQAFVECNDSDISKREELIAQNKMYQYEIDNYERNNFEFIKKHSNEVLNLDDSAFLRMLLSNGYLNENYRDYLSKSGDSFMAENDKLFIRSVIQNEPLSLNDLKLTSPSVICNKLSQDKFNRVAILNTDFVNYMFSANCSDREKRGVLSKYIKTDNGDVKRYIAHYFNSDNEVSPEFIKCLFGRKDFLRIIKESSINDEKINTLLIYILENISAEVIQNQDQVIYLIRRLMANEEFKKNIINFSAKLQFLQNNSFRINDLEKYDYSIETLKVIDQTCIWDLNLNDMIYMLSNVYSYSREEVLLKGYSLINKLNPNTRDYIINDISSYIHEIMLASDIIELEPEDFIYLLENDGIALDDKCGIIRKQSNKVNYFDCDSEVLMLLLDNDKIVISLEELIKVLESKEELIESSIEFLIRNKSEYGSQKIKSAKVVYAIANFDAKDGSCTLEKLDDFIEIGQLDMTKIQSDNTLVFLVDSLDKIPAVAVEYISSNDYLGAQKHLACRFIDNLLKNNLINSTLAKVYVRYGNNIESRIELYKREDVDFVEDYSTANKVMNDILVYSVKISDKLYNKLMTMEIDKKQLFVSQLRFMNVDLIWERLPLVDSGYSELMKNKKISIDKSDMVLEALHKKKLLRKTKRGYAIV